MKAWSRSAWRLGVVLGMLTVDEKYMFGRLLGWEDVVVRSSSVLVGGVSRSWKVVAASQLM